ncbi:MAG: MFS transporter [Alphaproteobacteria bacterium]|nr:MFS transporter [Alphaproteobacteria bacterium]
MPPSPKFHYGWIVVGVTCLALLTGAGVRSTPGILMVPLETEFGWSRATIALAVSINLILYGCIGPFAAAIMDRFGLRRSVLSALALLAVGVSSTVFMRESWQLILLWGFLVGGGTGFLATVLAATVAARWFTARRGLVTGVLSGGAATGQLLFLPIMASVTAAYGWRTTVLAVAGVALCVIVPIAIFMRDRPSDVGLMPYGESGEPKPAPKPAGNPLVTAFRALGEASKKRDFWLLAGTFFVCGASTNGLIGTHLIPACSDAGIAATTAAGMLAVIGVFNFIGTTGSGWLSDRYDNRKLLCIFYTLRGVSLLFLPFSFFSFYGLALFAVFYGLDWFATVSPTVRLVTNTFGREKAGIVYGWIFVAHQLGGASAAFFGGLFRVNLGSYLEAFIISGLLCFIAAIMALYIGREGSAPRPVPQAA